LGKPTANQSFKVKVVFYDAKGKPKPLAGATVTAGAVSAEPLPHAKVKATTNSRGIATLTEHRHGLIVLRATRAGYIRSRSLAANVAGATTAAGAAAARSAPRVELMVVGRDGTVIGARGVRARGMSVRIGRRRCAVPAATALAALLA